MSSLEISLDNLVANFPSHFTSEQKSRCQTLFYKYLSYEMHKHYQGKMQTLPRVGVWGFNWFNVWYTPGVSSVSTSIRDNDSLSLELSNRGNLVAVVTDSTRVLGDGDCGASGGLGVMEGKSLLMKYLADVDAISLCINNRDSSGVPDADKLIDFVKMVSPSFGAINLEDISHPNCYRVLEELRESCDIPVWHDDAQGTACVTLAGILNSLKLVKKRIEDCKIVLLGAGASNTTVSRFLFLSGADPNKTIIFNSKGGLHRKRYDIRDDVRLNQQWDLCLVTNPLCINEPSIALRGADILIALSTPGPDVVKPDWIRNMNVKPIVFACANPIPEIYPYAAKSAGAYIVATGRGDFPNQVNNSLGFPGILKGALLVRARKITDNMAIAASLALAKTTSLFRGKLTVNNILPLMSDYEVYSHVAESVAQQAIKDGVARVHYDKGVVQEMVLTSIIKVRKLIERMEIEKPSSDLLHNILDRAIQEIEESNK